MLLFNACDDFLDVRPKSEKVENEQFKDAQGFEDAIYGVYGELQNTYSYGRFMYWGFTEVLAQNLACYQDQAEIGQPLSELDYEADAVKEVIANMWEEAYKNIGYINNILENLEGRNSMTLYNYYRGEMLAMRAFLHFDLLRLFAPTDETKEGIPYVETYSYDVKPFYKVGEVYDKILKDLNEAESLLAEEENSMDYPRTDNNLRNFLNYRTTHFNLYAIWALKARVYWTRGDMANAAIYAEKVIKSEKFPLAYRQEMADYLAGKLSEKETIFGVYSNSYLESVRALIFNQTSFVSFQPYLESSGGNDLRTFEDIYALDNDNTAADYRMQQLDNRLWRKIIDYYTLKGESGPSGWDARYSGFTLMHVSEMYLIAAEALLETNYDLAVSYFDAETYLTRIKRICSSGQTTYQRKHLQ